MAIILQITKTITLSLIFGAGPGSPSGYVAEDGVTFYVAEDGATFYVQE